MPVKYNTQRNRDLAARARQAPDGPLPDRRRPEPPPREPVGLGDLVAAVATPIARALRMKCIDPETKQLRPESGCAKRKAALNRLKF